MANVATAVGAKNGQVRIRPMPLGCIRPSPENEKIYRPVSPDDPDVIALAKSIREHGIKEPLFITLDNYILSGHRRHVAAQLAGLREAPCRVENIRRWVVVDAAGEIGVVNER